MSDETKDEVVSTEESKPTPVVGEVIDEGSEDHIVTTVGGQTYNLSNGRYKLTKNNAVFDTEARRFVGNLERPKQYYSDMIAKRWEKYVLAAEDGIKMATEHGSSLKGWAMLTKAMANIVLNSKGKESVMAYQALMKSLGLNQQILQNRGGDTNINIERLDARLSQIILRKLEELEAGTLDLPAQDPTDPRPKT